MRGSDFIRHSDPDLVKFQAGYASLFGGMARGIDTSVATTERITCLCGLWGQKNATSGETCAGTDFQQAAYEVLYECVGSMCKVFEHTQAKTRNVKQNLTILPECKKIIKRLCLLVKKPLDRTLIPQYRFNKTKQHIFKGHALGCRRQSYLQIVAPVKQYMLSILESYTRVAKFPNVIMPSTPTPSTFNLQLFLDSLIFVLLTFLKGEMNQK